MGSNALRWGGAALILLVALAFTAVAQQEEGEESPAPEKKPVRTEFLRRMYSTDRAAYGDAVRLVHSVISDAHSSGSHADLLAELEEKGIARADWELGEDDKVRKGVLAYMLVQALEIDGGVTIRIFGVSQRYALRELNYLKVLTGRYVEEFVTGREVIDVLQRARIYRTKGSLDMIRE
ncbi:MAG: hypothetical protein ACYTAF_01260 [Planctomycetota bacterium]|jgi:hypothetical protein